MKQKKLKTALNTPKLLIPIVLAISSLFYLGGCAMYIPTPEHGYSHMKEVSKDMLKQLEPGITTKDDVRLLIGDHPHRETDDSFCYYWKRKDGYWFWFIGAGYEGYGDWGSTEDEHAFCVEFMPNSKLKRFKHFKSGWFKTDVNTQIAVWADEPN